MTAQFKISIRCDRCGDWAHTESEKRPSELAYEVWTAFPDWGRISGLSYEQIDLCPTCQRLFTEFMALEM